MVALSARSLASPQSILPLIAAEGGLVYEEAEGGGGPGPQPPDDTFTLGVTKPVIANSGLTTATTSTSSGSAITYSTNDQVIENVRFDRYVSVTGKRIVFRNCWFRGPASHPASDARGLVNCTNSNCEDLEFENCLFEPQTPGYGIDGLYGHDFLAYRCIFRGAVDGIGAYKSTGGAEAVRVQGCLFYGHYYLCPNPIQSDNRTHNDGIQLHGDPIDIELVGNTFEGFINPAIGSGGTAAVYSGATQTGGYQWHGSGLWATSAILTSKGSSYTTLQDVLIDQNWIDGGYASINFGTWLTGSGLVISDNRWGRDQRYGEEFTIIAQSALSLTITGNTYEDNGASFNDRQNG